ncbi:MAG: CapA family protein [Gammaproteobacteria bacterium]|nr:capsule biosynthesis protein [Gammaproteobacteria bacterium]
MVDFTEASLDPDDVLILLAGDLVLDAEEPDHWLSGIAPAVRAAHVSIGHLEVPHTRRGKELIGDVPAAPAAPEHLDALARCGFTALTLGGNHIADWGGEGIEDTRERLDRLGIEHTGAGATLAEARRSAWLECRGKRIAVLSYNCVGPEAGWASAERPGCNYLRIATADGSPVAPAAPLAHVTEEALRQLREDVAAVRADADVVVVALHKGIVHTPAKLAPYERPLAAAAVAAGADIVVGHHAHLLRGIEMVNGRPVFHGLGNACVVTHALSPGQDHPARAAWVARRRKLFGFEPDPRYTLAPFHPDAVHGALGVVILHADGRRSTGVVPLWVEPPGRPLCVDDERAEAAIEYLDWITREAGMPALRWRRASTFLWLCDPLHER